MNSRLKVIAVTILTVSALASIPARADTPYTTSRFEITFADGWQSLTTPTPGDSVLALMSTVSMMGYCIMSAAGTDHPITAQELDAYFQTYGGGDSVTKVSDGSKVLGGKTFTYAEYKSTDTTNGDIRIRVYYTTSGSTLFSTVLVYDNGSSANPIDQVETALGTLSLTPTPIRAVAARAPAWRPADHDILGRMRAPMTRTALFRLPLR